MATKRTGDDFNPEEIKHVRKASVRKPSSVKRTDLPGNVVFNRPIFAENFRAVMMGKCIAYEEMRNGVDIAAYDPGPEFGGFSQRGSTSHKRVKNNQALQTNRSIEGVQDIGSGRCKGSENNRPKNRAQPLCPPFVNVVERTIYLFPPAFQFRDVADPLEWKSVVLKSATIGKPAQTDRDFLGTSKIEAPLALYTV